MSGNDRDVYMPKAKAARVNAKAEAKAKANFEGPTRQSWKHASRPLRPTIKSPKKNATRYPANIKDVCIAELNATNAKEKAALEADQKSMAADYKLSKERCSTLSCSARRPRLKDAKIKFDR